LNKTAHDNGMYVILDSKSYGMGGKWIIEHQNGTSKQAGEIASKTD
jgi:hypothetical protein